MHTIIDSASYWSIKIGIIVLWTLVNTSETEWNTFIVTQQLLIFTWPLKQTGQSVLYIHWRVESNNKQCRFRGVANWFQKILLSIYWENNCFIWIVKQLVFLLPYTHYFPNFRNGSGFPNLCIYLCSNITKYKWSTWLCILNCIYCFNINLKNVNFFI